MKRIQLDYERFSLCLIRQRMTLKELCKLSGYSRATVSAVRNGMACSELIAQAIADALGVPLASLVADGQEAAAIEFKGGRDNAD